MATELVVGIDFGTTHSGVSWAVNGGERIVRLIKDWPNPKAAVAESDKVPTKISYRDGRPNNWGFNVDLTEESFQWFKVLLEPNHKYINTVQPVKSSNKLLGTLNKSAQDVVTDYLSLLWDYTKEDIRKVRGSNWEAASSVKVVLTVPAIWSDFAKDRTLKAAEAAGLPKDITLVAEPEAAALAVLKDAEKLENPFKPGDAFVVCDAGGGTVDLISYKIRKVDPLEVEECAIGDGGLCGSVFLDLSFEKWVKTIVGEAQYSQIKERFRKKMLLEFENGVKRAFTGDNKEYSVDLITVEDNPSEGIISPTITVKPNLLKTVFDHVCNQIMQLVEKQIDEVEEKDLKVKAVLLVGGFGASKYLHQQLERRHQGNGIQVLQVNGAWSSICRGATLWGLEHSGHTPYVPKTVVSRIARVSYGVCVMQQWDSSVHKWKDRYEDPMDGKTWANNQMNWLLKKGDVVEEGKILHTEVNVSVQVGFWDSLFGDKRSFAQTLYWCADRIAPTRKEDSVKELCSVDFEVECDKLWIEKSKRNPTTGQKYRDATFTLAILLDNTTLHYVVLYGKDITAHCEAKYKEDF